MKEGYTDQFYHPKRKTISRRTNKCIESFKTKKSSSLIEFLKANSICLNELTAFKIIRFYEESLQNILFNTWMFKLCNKIENCTKLQNIVSNMVKLSEKIATESIWTPKLQNNVIDDIRLYSEEFVNLDFTDSFFESACEFLQTDLNNLNELAKSIFVVSYKAFFRLTEYDSEKGFREKTEEIVSNIKELIIDAVKTNFTDKVNLTQAILDTFSDGSCFLHLKGINNGCLENKKENLKTLIRDPSFIDLKRDQYSLTSSSSTITSGPIIFISLSFLFLIFLFMKIQRYN